MEDGTPAYSPRCHMRSTVALIVRITHTENAMAVNATMYVLSMALWRASDMPVFQAGFDGLPAETCRKAARLLRVQDDGADMPFPRQLQFAGAAAFIGNRI